MNGGTNLLFVEFYSLPENLLRKSRPFLRAVTLAEILISWFQASGYIVEFEEKVRSLASRVHS